MANAAWHLSENSSNIFNELLKANCRLEDRELVGTANTNGIHTYLQALLQKADKVQARSEGKGSSSYCRKPCLDLPHLSFNTKSLNCWEKGNKPMNLIRALVKTHCRKKKCSPAFQGIRGNRYTGMRARTASDKTESQGRPHPQDPGHSVWQDWS